MSVPEGSLPLNTGRVRVIFKPDGLPGAEAAETGAVLPVKPETHTAYTLKALKWGRDKSRITEQGWVNAL